MTHPIQLIAYADRLGGTIPALGEVVRDRFAGAFGGVHILPFFTPFDGADAGFDPDHTRIVSLPPRSVFLPFAAHAWTTQRKLRSHLRLAERAALALVGAIMWVVGTFGLLEAVVVTARRRT